MRANTAARAKWRRSGSERGAVAIVTAFVLVVMIALFGFALDLGRSYNRNMELHGLSDATALAAANALNGSAAGIDNAVQAAANAALPLSYAYMNGRVQWSAAALTFGSAPDGGSRGWMDAAQAKANAAEVFFARVDTSQLGASHGRVENVLMPILSNDFAVTNVAARSVAGRDSLNVLPLAVCANSNTPVAPPGTTGELIQFGFRRGVGYDLMALSPSGGAPQNFLVNPVAPAGTVGTSMMGRMDLVAAYVCTGKLAIPTLQGSGITVEPGFPIGSLYKHLNSRFGTYEPPCQASSAPADPVTRNFDASNATWVSVQPPNLSVGPLWSYARAAKYASYVANNGIEPAAGYDMFNATAQDWKTLYPGPPIAVPGSYPKIPYQQTAAGVSAYGTVFNSRVLRIPLLQCPVPAGARVTATVLGIGKFFMTIPATSASVTAEFAGMDSAATLGGNARLY